MAAPYTQYTSQQINDFINQKGIGSDPWAMYNFRQQYNADPAALDAARGWAPGTAQGFMDQAQQTLAGPIAGTRELDTTNPHMAYALAMQRGNTAGQADTMYGMDSGTAAGWAQQQGYTGFGAPSGPATMPPIGGTPAPAANSPATPNPYLSGASSASPSVPTGPGTWIQPGLGAPTISQGAQPRADFGITGRGNPYMPAGGAGSNFGNDPRIGGPRGGAMGNQGLGGLADYLFQNPSTRAMGNEVTRGVMNTLQRQALPAIRGNAMASGTVGGSRQGVAEGLATGEAMSGLAGALANLYGNQFNQDRSYGLANDTLDFNIHQGNLGTMRQGQLDQMNFLGQIAGLNQQGIGVANQTRDRPFTDWQRFVGPASQMAGLGGQQTQNLQGNPYLGALGGYLAGSKMFGG